MKTLIIWGGKYGFTEKCAGILKEKLPGDTDIVSAKEIKEIRGDYDAVILGSPVYAGGLSKEILRFIEANRAALLEKKLGFFISCFDEDYDQYIKKNLDGEMYDHIRVKGRSGYAFDFKQMGFFERTIIKMISKKKESVEYIDEEAIKVFADHLQKNE